MQLLLRCFSKCLCACTLGISFVKCSFGRTARLLSSTHRQNDTTKTATKPFENQAENPANGQNRCSERYSSKNNHLNIKLINCGKLDGEKHTAFPVLRWKLNDDRYTDMLYSFTLSAKGIKKVCDIIINSKTIFILKISSVPLWISL